MPAPDFRTISVERNRSERTAGTGPWDVQCPLHFPEHSLDSIWRMH